MIWLQFCFHFGKDPRIYTLLTFAHRNPAQARNENGFTLYRTMHSTDPCCGSGMFIPNPNFFHLGSGSTSKNFSINCFYALGNMIQDVYPGFRILDPDSDPASGYGSCFFIHPGFRGQKSSVVEPEPEP